MNGVRSDAAFVSGGSSLVLPLVILGGAVLIALALRK